jgi:hypothetical protein
MKKVLLGLAVDTLALAVLCLMMIATVGSGAAIAKQDENPSQAGESSIYFYDVAASDNHGKGKLVIDVDKHTFVFNGQDFRPGRNIQIIVDTESGVHIVGQGESTKSGNVHVEGEWEGALPEPGTVRTLHYYEPAWGFRLYELGGYVAHIKVQWSTDDGATWHTSSNQSSGVSLWESKRIDIKTLDPNIPIGSVVRMKMIVVWGDDVVADQWFSYVEHRVAGQCYPDYESHGKVWNAYLLLQPSMWCFKASGYWCEYGTYNCP